MAKKSLFSRLAKALTENDNSGIDLSADRDIADIDRDLEAAVQAIKEAKSDTLAASDVLGDGWAEGGDMVYIMDLAPIYGMIGGPAGRMAANLLETCQLVFSLKVGQGRRRSFFEGDLFIMRFAGIDHSQSSRLAAEIVNEIGVRILGVRFQTMEAPGLMVVADAAEITDPDGSLNLEKAEAAVQDGGLPMAMDEPGDDAPQWLRMRWANRSGDGAMGVEESRDRDGEDPEWVAMKNGPGGSRSTEVSLETISGLAKEEANWQELEYRKAKPGQKVKRGDERRTSKSKLFLGDERHTGKRRSCDDANQMIW